MRKLITLAAVILALSLTACAPKTAQVYKIKFGHDMLEASAQHIGASKFKELVEAASKGRIEVTIFPNSTLGTGIETAEMLQTGSVQAALIPTAKLSGFYAPIQIIDLPFLFPSREALYGTLDSAEFKKAVFEPMEELGFKGINFWESGFKQFTANKDLKSPADFVGQKFRVMESPLIIAQFNTLGANPVPIDFGETYNALQQKVVDGEENPLVSIKNMKFYEVQTHVVISNHAYLGYAFLFSNKFWKTLPKDLQTIVLDAADKAAQLERQTTIDSEAGYIKIIQDYGTTVSVLTADEIAVFAQAMKPVHEQFRSVIGSDLLNKTYQIIDSFN